MKLISDDQVEAVHTTALQILEEIGMDVLNPEARALYAEAGAIVTGEQVRIGRDIVDEALKTPPASFTFHGRNPAHNIEIGGKWIAFGRSEARPTAPIRTGAAAGHARGQCQLHPPGAVLQLHPHGGRRLGRCARCPCLGASPAHHAQQGHAFRQVASIRSRPDARGCSTAWRSPAWRAASARSSS